METTTRILERGEDLYRAGKVVKTPTKGVFLVGKYTADTRTMTCECSWSTHKPHLACKHLVASLFRMTDDLRYPKAS